MRIAVLGPMAVAGRGDIQLRDRIVLGALLVRPRALVGTDEIGDALWGDQPPASGRKVIQGSIVRLRRVLGTDTIRTSDGGYVLDLAEADVDAGVFGDLVDRGRAQLADGYAERSAATLRQALALWRGIPLPELAGWAPAESEVARLVRQREAAEDLLVEATMSAGHADQAASLASALAEQDLYREPRWALWARCLYAAGRQAEALNVLARLRRALDEDLGIVPGREVVDLEVAMLRQEPSLDVPPAQAAGATCPWPGLLCYEAGDALFGRDDEVTAALDRLGRSGALVVVGRSGIGKSSFVRAGVAPHLSAAVITPGSGPLVALAGVSAEDLVVDQAEELLTQCDDPAERVEFVQGLADWPGRIVVVVRADRIDELAAYAGFASLLERGLFVLQPLDERGLRAAIEGPAGAAGLRLEPGLVDLLVAECLDEPGGLPLLSHVLTQTWQRVEGNALTVAGYQASGGIKGAVASTAEQVYLALPESGRDEMRRLFRRLVTAEDGTPVRLRVPRDAADPHLVEGLLRGRLLGVADDGTLQLAHESLARHWPRLTEWLAEDRAGQRVLRHLSAEAGDWESRGRPVDALYRGVRLESALGWAATHEGDLTASERAFLTASRESAEGEMRQARRANNRLRIALAAAGALLLVAVAGIGLAIHQERQAEAARDAALQATQVSEAMRLGAQAATEHDPTIALALAAESLATADTAATRTSALETFGNFPALLSTGQPPDGTDWPDARPSAGSTALSPDGDLRASVSGRNVVLTDAESNNAVATIASIPTEPTALAFNATGELLAGGLSEVGFADTGTTLVWRTDTGTEVGRFKSGDGPVWSHMFAGDGSSVYSYGQDGIHQWDLTASRALVRAQDGDPTTYRAGDTVLSQGDESTRPWIDLACRLAGRQLTPQEWREYLGQRPYRPTCR